jgi:hypothetical protein
MLFLTIVLTIVAKSGGQNDLNPENLVVSWERLKV